MLNYFHVWILISYRSRVLKRIRSICYLFVSKIFIRANIIAEKHDQLLDIYSNTNESVFCSWEYNIFASFFSPLLTFTYLIFSSTTTDSFTRNICLLSLYVLVGTGCGSTVKWIRQKRFVFLILDANNKQKLIQIVRATLTSSGSL